MAISHLKFIRYMQTLGYDADDNGICYGVAHMGVQAILSEDTETFDERFDDILMDIHSGYQLTAADRNDAEITPFLDGVEIYMYPERFSHLFENDKVVAQIDFLNSATLISSLKIEEQKGIYQALSMSGVYDCNELEHFFETLKESVNNSISSFRKPVALALYSSNHAIAVGYDPIKDKWLMIDAANLPTKYSSSNQEIAEAVKNAFYENPSDKTMFCTNVLGCNQYKDNLDKIIEDWKKNDIFEAIHTVSLEKANHVSENGSTWLHVASTHGHFQVVDSLLKQKKTSAIQVDGDGWMPLHCAIQNSHIDVANKLIKFSKTKLNQANNNGSTALHLAAENGNTEIVRVLLKQKEINPNLVDKKGVTSLQYAEKNGSLEVVRELLTVVKKDLGKFEEEKISKVQHPLKEKLPENIQFSLDLKKSSEKIPNIKRKFDEVENLENIFPDAKKIKISLHPKMIRNSF